MRGDNQTPAERRFWAKVDKRGPDECWPWTASKNAAGYGWFGFNGRVQRAHRVAFQIAHSADISGQFVCHSCDSPSCVNPAHLWLGSPRDNMRDMAAKGRAATQRRHGEANPRAKLSLEQARNILRDQRGPTEIAADYGVSVPTICAVKSGQNWSVALRGE